MKMMSIIVALTAFVSSSVVASASDMEGKELYTQVNMHSVKNDYVSWVNYAVDTLIPVNTKVIITSIDDDEVEFTIKETGVELEFANNGRSGLDDDEWAAKHFGENKVDLKKFSKLDQKGIKKAKVIKGMTKDGVIVARGFPPAHVTPSLDMNEWMYWHNRWNKKKVFFKDGKVSRVQD